MTLNIKDAGTHELARRLAAATGESLASAVRVAIEERLARLEKEAAPTGDDLADRLDAIGRRCGALDVVRDRGEDDILGYDGHGLPGRW